jgi:ribosomal protein S18 acetylase RimI-like enzyme
MYVLYTQDPALLSSINEDGITLKHLDDDVVNDIQMFLWTHGNMSIMYKEPQFRSLCTPIFVVEYGDDDKSEIVTVCECLYSPSRKLIEIYNVCVHKEKRRQCHATQLKTVIDYIQLGVKTPCTMWISVSCNNLLYTHIIRLYKNMGFKSDGIHYHTPENVFYPLGFMVLTRNFVESIKILG